MNTHDMIELPPLPPGCTSYEFPDGGYDKDEMRTYAISAIEADRQRRGEPVDVEITALIANMAAFLKASGDPYAYPLIKHAREVLSDPQPANPVVKDSLTVEPVAWPKTAAEIRDFINVHYISMAGDDDPSDDDKYTLTAHDLLSAFRWWTGFAPQPAEPVKVVSEDERSAQGLPPYNPRKPTEEEWARLTKNGRKAWGAQPAEPVKVPSEAKEALWKAYESLRELEKRIVLDVNQISGAAAASFAANRVLALLARYGATTQEQS